MAIGVPSNLGAMAAYVGVNTAGIKTGAASAMRQMKALERTMAVSSQRIGASLSTIGSSMTMKLTLPIAGALGGGAAAWVGFQDAMTKSTAIMGDVTDELRVKMEATAKTLAGEGPKSAKELAESYFFLASAGLSAEQSISALPVVMRFATAGAFDMTTATDLLTDAQTALGMSAKDAVENERNLVRISDVLVKANTLANASVQQFSESLTSEAANASQMFGQTLESTTAVLAAFADRGIKGAVAGSLYGRGLRILTQSFRKHGEAFQKYGIEVVDKATGKYKSLVDIVADMEKAFAGMTKPEIGAALEEMGFGARVQQAITPLLGASEKIREYENALKNAGETTQQVFDRQMESPLNQLKIFWNQLTLVGMTLFESVLPAIKVISKAVGKFAEWLGTIDKNTMKWIGSILLTVASIGPLLLIGGKLLSMLSWITTAVRILKVAMLVMSGPIGILVLGLTLIGVALAKNKDFVDWFRKAMVKTSNFIQQVFAVALDSLHLAALGVGYAFVKFGRILIGVFFDVGHALRFLAGQTKWAFDNMDKVGLRLWHNYKRYFINLAKNLRDFGAAVWLLMTGRGFKFQWTSITEGMKDVFEGSPEYQKRALSQMEADADKWLNNTTNKMGELKNRIVKTWKETGDELKKSPTTDLLASIRESIFAGTDATKEWEAYYKTFKEANAAKIAPIIDQTAVAPTVAAAVAGGTAEAFSAETRVHEADSTQEEIKSNTGRTAEALEDIAGRLDVFPTSGGLTPPSILNIGRI